MPSTFAPPPPSRLPEVSLLYTAAVNSWTRAPAKCLKCKNAEDGGGRVVEMKTEGGVCFGEGWRRRRREIERVVSTADSD